MSPRKFAHSCFSSFVNSLLPKDNLFKNTFDFTTAGDWDFNTTSRYLDDILNINNVYFANLVSQV